MNRDDYRAFIGGKQRKDEEADLQTAIWSHIQVRGNPKAMAFHCPNGEHRSKATGGRLKAMGVVPGVADFVCVQPNGEVAFMELKRLGGVLSPAQKLFQARCISIGVTYVVVADIDTALAILEGWRIILPEAEF